MTIMTCKKCGHVGEHLVDSPGFCARCKTFVAVMGNGADASTPAPGRGAKAATEPSASKLSRRMSLWIAAACTVLQWALLLCVAFVGTLVSAFIHFREPVSGFNKFTLGLVLGGLVATAIGWVFAFRRHPVAGATIGAAAGVVTAVLAWLVILRFFT